MLMTSRRGQIDECLFPLPGNYIPIKTLAVFAACRSERGAQWRISQQLFQSRKNLAVRRNEVAGLTVNDRFWLIVLPRNYRKPASRSLKNYLGRSLPSRRK